MNATVSQPLSASEFAALLPTSPTVLTAWSAFSIHVIDRQESLHMEVAFADHLLTWQFSGACRLRREAGGRSVEGWSGPGTVNLVPAHFRATWDVSGASRNVDLHIPGAFLSRIIAQDWDVEPRNVEIVPQFLARDPVIESVLASLKLEVQNGSPSGQLYAESASEFLAHHIIHVHSSLSALPPPSSGGLTGRRLKIVLDYIQDSLAEPIALRQLAELARVSPRHFERAFRQAVGTPPHAYVMEKRVAAARHLLLSEPTLTIESIAARVGFSSSSHLASAFRRQTGYSPAAFRRTHSH